MVGTTRETWRGLIIVNKDEKDKSAALIPRTFFYKRFDKQLFFSTLKELTKSTLEWTTIIA